MPIRPLLLALVVIAALGCSDDSNPAPTARESSATTTVARPGSTTTTTTSVPTSTTTLASKPGPTITSHTRLPERCTATTDPIYPNPATERWVPAPESGDVVDDFARLVLGWPDVQVEGEQADGSVTLIRITSGAAPQPVELVLVPEGEGNAVSVCSARSVADGEWSASVLVEGAEVVSGFGIWVDENTLAAVHEVFPDVVSAQLLISHGPHVQQVAATDPEQGWSFELDHPTTEPGWQLAFWRDADGAALAVMDTDLPAGDFAAS